MKLFYCYIGNKKKTGKAKKSASNTPVKKSNGESKENVVGPSKEEENAIDSSKENVVGPSKEEENAIDPFKEEENATDSSREEENVT